MTVHHWLPSSGWVIIVGRAHHLHYYIGQQNEGVYGNEGGQVEQYRGRCVPVLAHEHIELLVGVANLEELFPDAFSLEVVKSQSLGGLAQHDSRAAWHVDIEEWQVSGQH